MKNATAKYQATTLSTEVLGDRVVHHKRRRRLLRINLLAFIHMHLDVITPQDRKLNLRIQHI
jgi:hypothetical protein